MQRLSEQDHSINLESLIPDGRWVPRFAVPNWAVTLPWEIGAFVSNLKGILASSHHWSNGTFLALVIFRPTCWKHPLSFWRAMKLALHSGAEGDLSDV